MPTLLPKRKATRARAPARAPVDPAWSETLACTHAPGTGTGRSPARPQALGPSGPHREGEEPSPMMHGREKSDLAIGAAKPANNDGRPSAELVEQRAGAEGNAGQDRTRRAQDRASVSQGLDRVRHVARQRKKERFTALLHHVTPNRLRTAFFALKRQAAPGVDGLTWQAYEADLDRRIEGLHERVHRGAYRALPARRGFIPKADGSQRPLAIAALERPSISTVLLLGSRAAHSRPLASRALLHSRRNRPIRQRCPGRFPDISDAPANFGYNFG